MKLQTIEQFSLDHFEGPLDLLWHLIQRQEIDIYEVSLQKITQQYIAKYQEMVTQDLDNGAEFIALAASLIWLKSKTLLPVHEQQTDPDLIEESDPNFEVIHQLLDYCRFKQAAKTLSDREAQQSAYYLRGMDTDTEVKKNLGIAHLSLDDLASMFREILSKAKVNRGLIHEESWRVSDKIKALQYLLKEHKKVAFQAIFTIDKSRIELIVTFLALLELMKSGHASVILDPVLNTIVVVSKEGNHG